MDAASITALSVLGGSVVGALTSLASSWLTQAQKDRRELLGKQIADRETLYANFIAECSRAVIDSRANTLDRSDKLIPLYALFGHIRLSSSDNVVIAAEKVVHGIIVEYLHPKSVPAKSRTVFDAKDQLWIDPLAEFSHVCREELRNLAQRGTLPYERKKPTPQSKSHSGTATAQLGLHANKSM